MDNKRKQEIFKKINKIIKDEITVSKTELTENNMSYCITGYLYKGIDIDYSIRKKGEIAICKITTGINGNDDTNTDLVVKELTEPNEMNFTGYDGKYVIQKVISFKDQSDKTVEKNLIDCISTIINMIKDNQEKFVIEYTSDSTSDKNYAQEETVQDEDDQNNDVETEEDEFSEEAEDIAGAIEEMTSGEVEDKALEKEDKDVTVDRMTENEAPKNLQRSRHIKRTKIEKKNDVSVKSVKKEQEEAVQYKNASEKTPEKNNESGDNSSTKSLEHIAEISSKLSKDTVKDINDMYNDISALFDKKSKEAEERQELLNKYAEKLKKQEMDIEIQKKQNEKDLAKKEIELEAKLKEKEEELQKSYTQKKVELEHSYSEKETALHQAEIEFSKQQEEIAVDRKKLDLEWKKLKMGMEELDSKRDQLKEMAEIKSLLGEPDGNTTDNELAEAYEKLQEEYNSLVDENNSIIDENDKMSEEYDKLSDWNKKLTNKLEKLNAQLEDVNKKYESEKEEYETRLSEYEDKLNKAENSASDNITVDDQQIQARISSLEQERDSYKKTAEELREKEVEHTSQFNDISDKYKKAVEEIENLKKASDSNMTYVSKDEDISAKATHVKEELAKIGVNVDVVVGAGDTILNTTYNECMVCINIKCDILYIEKKVKTTKKYIKVMEEWNLEDIRVAYLTAGNKIICKYAYDDVLKATKETLDRMEGLV